MRILVYLRRSRMLNHERKKNAKRGAGVFKILLLMSLVTVLSSCMYFVGGKALTLDKNSNGKTVEIASGQTLTIKLKGNATTGYRWILKKYNKKLVKFIDVNYVVDNNKLLGSGGTWVTNFEILKPGKSGIRFIYKRPWEKDKLPLEKFFVEIKATK
jgi:inhibitor of cysteine peptidase